MAAHTKDTVHAKEYDKDYEEERATRNFSTCKDVMKQINNEQKLLGKVHVSAILSTDPTVHRSTTKLHHRSTSVPNHHPPIRSDLEESDDLEHLEIFGVSTQDDHRARPSVNIEEE
ncbi:hypothetical protein F2Q70_00030236 [Brassica cretica]|uniref:Uncharacterized protein n=1 Tax=Brassica cretica TaxID=69181 RepID=A0A8S9FFX8_BRACR|nr:hypothetical protein F2Q70_00030236 [Brassica cretica]